MKKQFSVLLAILLSLSVLMGFSHANETGQASDNTVSSQVDYSIDGLRVFIAKLKCRDVQNFYANGYAEGLYMKG